MALARISGEAKDALARDLPAAAHCRDALYHGLALYGSRRGMFVTRRNAVARLFSRLHTAGDRPAVQKSGRRIAFAAAVARAPAKPSRRCDRVMEARAAFLACGSLSASSHGYHLEFVVSAANAERLSWVLRALGVAPKRMRRNERDVLYYKDFEAIVALLTIVGAHPAVLELEGLHALKETKNRIHRLVNTEAANVERSTAAAARQRETIEFVVEMRGFQRLTPALREIAQLRLAHPHETLAELGRRCDPPISKPTVNSRLGALARMARQLRGKGTHASSR